jgi:hypothetical protein
MAEHPSPAIKPPGLLLALLAAFLLSGCVASHTRLLAGSNLLGDQFELNLFDELVDGKFMSRKTGLFRWSGARYEIASGDVSGVKFFRVESLSKDDLLVETTDDKDYVYFLARRLAEATYRFVPINENNLAKARQKRLCVMQNHETCTIETRAQLDAFARASMGKGGPFALVVISVPSTEGAH